MNNYKKTGETSTLFVYCPKVSRKCAMCAKSTYNPMINDYGDKEFLHCGMLTGYETRVDSLVKCWLDMDNKEKSKFKKQKKDEYFALNPSKMSGIKRY